MTISKYSKRPKFELVIPKGRYEIFKIEMINLDLVLATKDSNYTKYNYNFGRAMMPIPQELY